MDKDVNSDDKVVNLALLSALLNEIQINLDIELYMEARNNNHTATILKDTTWNGDLS